MHPKDDNHMPDDDTPGEGHNSAGFGVAQLRSFCERIERLDEERKAMVADIREVYNEAKGSGFDTKILRKVLALRKMDKSERMEMEALVDLYKDALGMS